MTALFRPKPPAVPEPPWPSALNPCYVGGLAKGHYKTTLWAVRGKVTKCCSQCVFFFEEKLRERQIPEPRFAALCWFFKPNPSGADCKYASEDEERRPVPPRPVWADELVEVMRKE